MPVHFENENAMSNVESPHVATPYDRHIQWMHIQQDSKPQVTLNMPLQSDDGEFKSVSTFVRPHALQLSPSPSSIRILSNHESYEMKKVSDIEDISPSFPDTSASSHSRPASNRSVHRKLPIDNSNLSAPAFSSEMKFMDSNLKNDILNSSTNNLRPASMRPLNSHRRSPVSSIHMSSVRGHDPFFPQNQSLQRFQYQTQSESALKKLIRDQV